MTVALEPTALSICPLNVSNLLESDRFGKAVKTWEAGGVVDLTEISENSLNSSTASGCLTFGGLRFEYDPDDTFQSQLDQFLIRESH